MKEKFILTIAVIADFVIFGVLLFNVISLRNEVNYLREKNSYLETMMENMEKEMNGINSDIQRFSTLMIPEESKTSTNTVNAAPTSEELETQYNKEVEELDKTIFVTDFSTYKSKTSDMQLTNREISGIAGKGFDESAKRIAAEGTENKASEKIEELDEIIPNNYFTRKYKEGDTMYKNLKTHGYKVTRTNEMGNGVYIYIDKTTGLIVGGGAFGD